MYNHNKVICDLPFCGQQAGHFISQMLCFWGIRGLKKVYLSHNIFKPVYHIWFACLLIPVFGIGQVASDKAELEKVVVLSDLLALTPKQSKIFQTTLQRYGKLSVEKMKTHSEDLPQLRKAIKDIQSDQDEDVKKFLLEDQYGKYLEAMREDRAERRRLFLQQRRVQNE